MESIETKTVHAENGIIVEGLGKTDDQKPTRSGACPFCTRKHLLKARGYAREVAEDTTREWELDNMLENLMLAEDHAVALGDMDLDAAIRVVRHEAEDGVFVNLAADAARLYADFKAKYFPTATNKEG